MMIVTFQFIILGVISIWVVESNLNQTLSNRLLRLRETALLDYEKRGQCSEEKFVFISEYPFGNSGNHIISLSHGLWVASNLKATLIVPNWIEASMKHFDLSILSKAHCFTLNPAIPKNKVLYEVTSEESFFIFQLFRQQGFAALISPLNEATVASISMHFLRVYAGLWSSPTPNIVAAGEWIISNHLEGKLDFTSVHKRNLDGGCGKIMSENTKPDDFSPTELPMNISDWQGDLRRHHPLCEMSVEFVKSTMALHGRAEKNLFVAFDGQGDVSAYRRHQAVFSSVTEKHAEHGKMPMKFVDMFVAMQADLFIQNPRSTFSLQIFVIRTCLDLLSVPTLANNDIFVQRVPHDLQAANRPLMVSWKSLQAAFSAIRSKLSPLE